MVVLCLIILVGICHGALCYWDYRERRLPTVWVNLCLALGIGLGIYLNPFDFWVGILVYGGLFAVIWGTGQFMPRGPIMGFGDVLLVFSMGPFLFPDDLWLFCVLSGFFLACQRAFYRAILQPLAPPLVFSFWVCCVKNGLFNAPFRGALDMVWSVKTFL